MSDSLKSSLIKLAHTHPEFRKIILPLLSPEPRTASHLHVDPEWVGTPLGSITNLLQTLEKVGEDIVAQAEELEEQDSSQYGFGDALNVFEDSRHSVARLQDSARKIQHKCMARFYGRMR